MTVYDDMRGYIHAHDRNGWFDVTTETTPMYQMVDKADAENAKLRELVRIMAYCNQFRRDCDGCSMNGAAGIITERAGCDELLAHMRDLGIEVPQ